MEMPENIPKKLIIGIVGILALFAVLYFFVFDGSSTADNDSLQATEGSGVPSEDQINTERTLQQLNRLQQIDINTSLFNSETFLSLQDFSITLNPHPIGRENPFVPSNYVPDGNTIVPSSDPVVPQPLDGSGEASGDTEAATTTPDSSDSNTSTTSVNDDAAESGPTTDNSQSAGS